MVGQSSVEPDATLPIVVIGAGAAGAMAAFFAAEGLRRVLVLERTADGGRKILISGGGRCNVLPSAAHPAQFVTASSPNTLRNMLRLWPLADQRQFFEETLGIRLALEEETGKLFPVSNRARDVRDTLYRAVRDRGAVFRFNATVTGLRPSPADGSWLVEVAGGETIRAAAVIVGTGGLSVPNTGSDGTGLRLMEELGHTVNTTYPALTPLTATPARHAELAGVSLTVTLRALANGKAVEATGGFLFTHRGYSGPVVLDLSHLAVRARLEGNDQAILAQWTGLDAQAWDEALRQGGAGTVASLLRREMPARLADALRSEAGVDSTRTLAELKRDERVRLVECLTSYPLPWTGDEGYKKAEVTGGGVSLGEVDPVTMESRKHRGLYLAGEILDAFGPIGGYNFLWAWATGRAAGRGVLRV